MIRILILAAVLITHSAYGQVKVTHITYQCTINPGKQNSNIPESKDENLSYYVDLFSYEDKVRTKVRANSSSPFVTNIKDVIYTQGTRSTFSIDDSRSIAFETSFPAVQLSKTGQQKKILGYNCYEWVHEPYKTKYWITDEVGVNISPTSNLGILGTVLEYEAPNGSSKIAIKISQTEISKDDLDLPQGYQIVNSGKSFSQIEMERVKWKDKQLTLEEFTDLRGTVHNATSLKGKIVVVNFWFTSCKPCIEEMPVLNELVKQYQDSTKVVFLAIAPDKKEKIEEFLKKREFNYSLIPSMGTYIQSIGVNSFPTNMILDKEGKVVYEATGFTGDTQELKKKLTDQIDYLLKKL